MNILFLITARGGSKGVPNKNIQEISGIPLLVYKAIAAKKSNYCTRLIISTDSEKIADVAKKYNIEIPFIRPSYLATDEANSMDVITHAMEWIENNDTIKYDAICLLEPSSPFLTYQDINNSVQLFKEKDALGVLGVKQVEVNSIFVSEIDEDLCMKKHYYQMKSYYNTRRQDLKPQYTMNGAIYLADWNYIKENRTFHGERTFAYIMPNERSIEIDSMLDLEYSRFLVKSNIVDKKLWDID